MIVGVDDSPQTALRANKRKPTNATEQQQKLPRGTAAAVAVE